MQKIRYGLIVLSMLMGLATSAPAQVSIGIGFPNVSIGINLPVFPELVVVPGYPVYYAPQVNGNYFFYDGMYWVYQDDNWYASYWYDGPWGYVEPEYVPLFVLRIPVRYYRQPPVYFRGWQSNAPPRWDQHWGHQWQQRRRGWDRWERNSAPAPAPLPVYQRQYTGDRYPHQVEQQQTLHSQQYRYQPRETIVREHYKQQREPAPKQRVRQENTPTISPKQQDVQRSMPRQQREPETRQRVRQENTPTISPKQQGVQRSMPHQQDAPADSRSQSLHLPSSQPRGSAVKNLKQPPGAAEHEKQAPMTPEQKKKMQEMEKLRDKEKSQEPGQGQGQNEYQERERGRNN